MSTGGLLESHVRGSAGMSDRSLTSIEPDASSPSAVSSAANQVPFIRQNVAFLSSICPLPLTDM